MKFRQANLNNFKFPSIINGMRLILSMASLLVISLVIFNGYVNSPDIDREADISAVRTDPMTSAANVSQVLQDAASLQRQALEQQLQK